MAGLCLGRGVGGKPKVTEEARQEITVAPGGLPPRSKVRLAVQQLLANDPSQIPIYRPLLFISRADETWEIKVCAPQLDGEFLGQL